MRPTAPVTVVIPTHQRRELLRRALASVYAQTWPAAEVVVVDDGSTDGTAAMVAAEFPAAHCLSQPRRGVSAARNRGVRESGQPWVAFLDSDDEWRPEKLERQLAALAAEDAARLCHCDEIWIRDGRRVNPRRRHAKSGGWIFRRCLPLCVISPSAVVIDRDLLAAIGGFDETLPACEDYDLWLRVTPRWPVLFVDEPLVVKHGGHPDQLSRGWGLDRYRIRALEKALADPALDEGDRVAVRTALLARIDAYLPGAVKRGKTEEIERYQALRTAIAGPHPDPLPN